MRPCHGSYPVLNALALWAGTALAAGDGLGRIHEFRDWLVACDNTRVCQAQGYADESGTEPEAGRAALIVERAAGPGRAPTWRFRFARFDDTDQAPAQGLPVQLRAGTLRLALPAIDPRNEELVVPDAQVPALRRAVLAADRLWLQAGRSRWWVSLAGARAALMKMDDLQGRLGTPGALVQRGSRPEAQVPQPLLPLVQEQDLPPTTDADRLLEPALRAALPGPNDDCPSFDRAQPLPPPRRLDARSLLVVQPCFRAAYQVGSRLWQVDDAPPHRARALRPPRPHSESIDDGLVVIEHLSAGGVFELHEAAKSRGLGDCWSTFTWGWAAHGLVLLQADQSPCRAFEGGGIGITLWRTQRR